MEKFHWKDTVITAKKSVKSQDWLTWGSKDNEPTVLTKADLDNIMGQWNPNLKIPISRYKRFEPLEMYPAVTYDPNGVLDLRSS